MIRIAICDDEKNIRTYLSSLVRKQNIECEITEYASTDEYLSDQKEHDLLFLDIEMKSVASGMDGMSMAKQIRATELTKQPIIIFVTGYEKYVYDAFDVGAFQYLLKPIDEQRFAQVFRRAAEQIISEAEQQKKTLVIQYANTSKAIPLDHIYYLESQSHKVVIHMNEEELEYYAKLGDLEALKGKGRSLFVFALCYFVQKIGCYLYLLICRLNIYCLWFFTSKRYFFFPQFNK